MEKLSIGKLDSELLEEIVFGNIHFKRPEVLTRPGIGEDCAVIDFEAYDCIISTDPITASISDIGRLSIHISCNDVASNGVQPLGIMLAVLLPMGTTAAEVEEMMRQAAEAAEELEVEIIGGHTEVTSAVNKPVIVSTALGRGEKETAARTEKVKPGDVVMMTKSAGLEGTGILACDLEEELKDVLTTEELDRAKNLLDQVSVVKEGVLAGKIGTSGMHDITEGGVLGALWEMCSVGEVGAVIEKDRVPVEDVTFKICNHFGIDYLRLISSGCMMIMSSPRREEPIKAALRGAGISVATIGEIQEESKGIVMLTEDGIQTVNPPGGDEIYKVVG